MREIIFRGKEKDTPYGPLWRYGDLIHNFNSVLIAGCVVDPETVGQYIGRKDKKHREIYEDDLVKDDYNSVYQVVYNEYFASFGLRRKQDAYMHYFGEAFESEDCEIIGNIHDNPDMLEATK